jgi:hypothetical protein
MLATVALYSTQLTLMYRAILVDYIRKENLTASKTTGLAFVFCDHQEKPQASDINAGLAKQLAGQSATVHPELWDMYEDLGTVQRRPDVQQLESLLGSLCASFDRVFLIVDALDECTDRFERRLLLTALDALQSDKVRIMVTSRPNLEDIQEHLRNRSCIEIAASDADVQKFLISKLRSVLGRSLTPELEEQVAQEIGTRAAGM